MKSLERERQAEEYTTYTLVASSNSGRFALDTPDGHDLTCGEPVAILLGGNVIEGRVEYKDKLSSISLHSLEEAIRQAPTRWYDGYYFIASKGKNICALCVGMQVRLLR